MMDGVKTENVLIVAKTYPNPSAGYVETVCTAGITETGDWIRLYPIKFRYLRGDQQFDLFQWISVDTIKNKKDDRPESRKVVDGTIQLGRKVPSQKGILERNEYIRPLVKKSMEEINDEYNSHYRTLAIFKPREITGFSFYPEDRDWSPEQKAKLGQTSLFDDPNDLPKCLLKVPFSFKCKFLCDDTRCQGHELKIIIWDFNWAYFTYMRKYKDEKVVLQKLEENWMSNFASSREGHLIVGTVHHYPTFNIVGVFSPSKEHANASMKPLFVV